MSAKQGDVEVIREGIAFQRIEKLPPDDPGWEIVEHALAALDRLAAALERAERERDSKEKDFLKFLEAAAVEYARAEKAEQELIDVEVDRRYQQDRARKAERALGEARDALRWLRMALGWAVFREDSRVWTSNEMRDIEAKIDAALLPSEDTSDES